MMSSSEHKIYLANVEEDDDSLPFSIEPHEATNSINQDSTVDLFGSNNRSSLIESISYGDKANSLLSASGLLMEVPGKGEGLFDELDKEEEAKAKLAAEERAKNEEMERVRIQNKFEEERKTEEQKRLIQEKEAEEEKARQEARITHDRSLVNGSNVMGSMHELTLNDTNENHDFNPAMTYSNISQLSTEPRQPQQFYSLSSATSKQSGTIPRYQPQEAGYGDASYYYSTSGSTQEIFLQQNQGGKMSPYQNNPVPSSTTAVQSSYTSRSQMLHSSPNQQAQAQQRHLYDNYGSSNSVQSPYINNKINGLIAPSQSGIAPTFYYSNTGLNMAIPANMTNISDVNEPQGGMAQYKMGPAPNIATPITNLSNGSLMPVGMIHHSEPRFNRENIIREPFVYDPHSFEPVFGPISVTDPILVQSPGLFSGPPHWTYAVVVRDIKKIEGQNEFSAVVSTTRRRYKHFVALEDRLRIECPGSILPVKPDKYATRAIDEATVQQSPQFAMQRALELETYLNGIRCHPIAGKSTTFRMFLTISDHLGAAWPEVSSSILTRLTEVGTTTAVKVAESTSAVISELNNENQIMAGEDSSELLALSSAEGMRMSAVLQSVPKIENAIALLADQAAQMSVNGLEIQKCVNHVLVGDPLLCSPFEILSSGLLRTGRRTSRMAVELGAASQVFTLHQKLCRYERFAFSDRRSALIKRRDARKEADIKAHKLHLQQYSLQSMGRFDQLSGFGRESSMAYDIAANAVREADEIAIILQGEVARLSKQRKVDWGMSMRLIAASMREAHAERSAIWENCRDAFVNGKTLSIPSYTPESHTFVSGHN